MANISQKKWHYSLYVGRF